MMSTQGDINWIAAKVGEIQKAMQAQGDARLDAFTKLLSSIETGLAELVDNVERGGGVAAIEALAQAMRDIKMAAPDVRVEPQINVNVPRQEAPIVTVNVPEQPPAQVTVNPTVAAPPITFSPVIPAQPAPIITMRQAESFEVRIAGAFGAPDKVMTITPIYSEEK